MEIKGNKKSLSEKLILRISALQKQRNRYQERLTAEHILQFAVLNDMKLENSVEDFVGSGSIAKVGISPEECKMVIERVFITNLDVIDDTIKTLDWSNVMEEDMLKLINGYKITLSSLICESRRRRNPVNEKDNMAKTLEKFVDSEIIETGYTDRCLGKDVYLRFQQWMQLQTSADVCTTCIMMAQNIIKKEADFYDEMRKRGFVTTREGKPANAIKFVGIQLS